MDSAPFGFETSFVNSWLTLHLSGSSFHDRTRNAPSVREPRPSSFSLNSVAPRLA
ncbi:hypothetical protein GQ607_011822 [Colletotrichum asianum]|uniref:Uncharacterized protein n=1 Tax=Colletotrichum asianum TaxID=702518 RepID=A0A8H3ZRE8_9PEZI|nr:hypothetical protein GQ607_011822 [Colletotrichum asianum]